MLRQLLILLAICAYVVSCKPSGDQDEQPGQVRELESQKGGDDDELVLPAKSARIPNYPVPYPEEDETPQRELTPPTMPTIDEDEPFPDDEPINDDDEEEEE